MSTTAASAATVEVFYSYSHQDAALRDALEKHLAILKRQGVITEWHDRGIGAGHEWAGEIHAHLNAAQIILLLISADFLASDYCYDVELKRAMERHEAGEARVIPIILRPVDWRGAPFSKLQSLPTDGKPVTSWANQDEAFLNIVQGIRAAVEERRQTAAPSSVSGPAVLSRPERPVPPTGRHLGSLVSKLCDRIAQEEQFAAFFSSRVRRGAGVPHVYVVRGEESERPDSLVERFSKTYIQEYANFKWGEQSGALRSKVVEWPYEGEVRQRQQRVVASLFKQFDPFYEFEHDDFSAAAFEQLSARTLNPIVILQHEIRGVRWDKGTTSVLAWYLHFWDEVSACRPAPQFLLFFNIVYPPPERYKSRWKLWLRGGRFDKKRIERELDELQQTRQALVEADQEGRTCPCLFMTELSCVEWDSVMSWFGQHRVYDDMKIWQDKCKEIFRISECRPMAEVEHELKRIHREFIERGGYV